MPVTPTDLANALASMRAGYESVISGIDVLEQWYRQSDPPPTPQPAAWWPSGGNPNNNNQDTYLEFCSWRGRPAENNDVALCFPTREYGWDALTSATSGQPGAWKRKDIRLIVQMPLFPKGDYTYARAASGLYRAEHKKLGRNWKAREAQGFKRPVFSLSWEPNHLKLHYWSGPSGSHQNWHSYAEFQDAIAQAVTAIREEYPEAEIALCMNGHDSPGLPAGKYPAGDPRNMIPDLGLFDVWAVDNYDQYPPSFGGTSTSPNRKDFDTEAAEVNGVLWHLELAAEMGKQFGVFEWAVVSKDVAGGNHGGDNPAFVSNMVGKVFRRAHGMRLPDGRPFFVGEDYYDDTAQGMSIRHGQNPNAARRYQELYAAA